MYKTTCEGSLAVRRTFKRFNGLRPGDSNNPNFQ